MIKVKSLGYLGFLIISFTYNSLLAQGELFTDINVIPPSPNASAIQKFVELPVSYYTGTPKISIPIFELKTSQLTLPISLDYHSSGLKVEEYASLVGAGWSLNAGGAISRSSIGLPDEINGQQGRKGYFFNSLIDNNGDFNWFRLSNCDESGQVIHYITEDDPYNSMDSVSMGFLDTEPDQFFASGPGISMKFKINKQRQIIKSQKNDVQIIRNPFNNPTSQQSIPTATGWKMIGDDGIEYIYKSMEYTTVSSSCSKGYSQYNPSIDNFVSSWYLDSIKLKDDWIAFEYETEFLQYPVRHIESGKFGLQGSPGPTTSYCINNTNVQAKRLLKIKSSNGIEIQFIKGGTRNDLQGGFKLSQIKVYKNNVFVSAYKLDQTYYGSNVKLKLNRVVRIDESGNEENNGYNFQYHQLGPFPSIDSKSQDYWGFFNGALNSSLLPSFKSGFIHVNKNSTTNREPSAGHCKVGSLIKLIYPTGGETEFDYELHEANTNSLVNYITVLCEAGVNVGRTSEVKEFSLSEEKFVTITRDGNLEQINAYTLLRKWNGSQFTTYTPVLSQYGTRFILPAGDYQLYAWSESGVQKSIKVEYENISTGNQIIGGLRIKSIKFYDPQTNSSINKFFDYSLSSSAISSGLLFSKPYLNGAISHQINGQGSAVGCANTTESIFINISASNMAPLATNNGSHIGYTKVTEYFGNEMGENGKQVYEFNNFVEQDLRTYPYTPLKDYSYINGLTKEVNTYSAIKDLSGNVENFKLVKSVKTTYLEKTEPGQVLSLNFKRFKNHTCYTCDPNNYVYNSYLFENKWVDKVSEEEIQYDGNIEFKKIMNYEYGSSLLPTRILTTNSYGEIINTTLTRSQFPALITKMESMKKIDEETFLITKGESTSYYGKLQLYRDVYNLNTQTYERRKEYLYSDGYLIGELNFSATTNFQPKAYIWDRTNFNLIASVENANYTEVFHTSFEGSEGTSGESYTGSKYFSGSTYTIPVNQRPSTGVNLILTYWYYDGSWKFREKPYDFVLSEPGATRFDEVRIYPQNAQMITYAYDSGKGIISITDANNKRSIFDYDNFNRLKTIKDSDKNIVQHVDYNYKTN